MSEFCERRVETIVQVPDVTSGLTKADISAGAPNCRFVRKADLRRDLDVGPVWV